MDRTDHSSGTCSPFQAVEAHRAYYTDEGEGRTRLAPPTEGGPRPVHGALQSRLHAYHAAANSWRSTSRLPSQSEMVQGTRDPAVGEEITAFFCITRKMTSLGMSPRRQKCRLRAGAHWDGLLDIVKARTSPLHHPEIHRLATPFSQILQKNSVIHP
jgi:hypothetical protein